MEVVFVVPEDGTEVPSPDPDWLRALVLTAGSEFWCAGSGQGWLRYTGPGGECSLQLTFNDRHGFFLEYRDEQREGWIPFNPSAPETKVAAWVGGDPIIVSSRFFVTRELASVAVDQFCATGERTELVPWVSTAELDWKFGWWDHPDVPLQDK